MRSDRRTEVTGELVVVGAGELARPCATPSSASRSAVRCADAPDRRDRPGAHRRRSTSRAGQPGDATGLGEPGRRLRLQPGLADADRARQPGLVEHRAPARPRRAPRDRRCRRRRTPRPSPTPRRRPGTSRSAAITSRGRRLVGGLVDGRKTASGHRRSGRAQRHPGAHPERPRLVRRRRHDLPRRGRVAVAADDDRPAGAARAGAAPRPRRGTGRGRRGAPSRRRPVPSHTVALPSTCWSRCDRLPAGAHP